MSQWIAGIARGHNSGVCLLKDGEIVFGKRKAGYTLKNRPATWIKQYDQWDKAWKEY